jgi:hypothetical protein
LRAFGGVRTAYLTVDDHNNHTFSRTAPAAKYIPQCRTR